MSRNGTFLSFLAGTLLFSAAAYAGPLLPCLTSTQSANGNVLVTDTLGFDDPDDTHPGKIVSSVYQVYRRYTERNESLRLNGPNAYWADPFWKVEFSRNTKSFPVACSYVLVPNNGEYLVFVGSTFGAALTIYHHRAYDPSLGRLVSQQGELVREFRRTELGPSDSPDGIVIDGTPEWFAGGVFSFSPDQSRLRYRDKVGRMLEVDLGTGQLIRLK